MAKKSGVGKAIIKTEKAVVDTVIHPFRNHNRTLGQRAADSLSKWAGSWPFIIGFFIFLGLWVSANLYAWTQQWDPYPFILLNLVLSCLAAVQAPVILMSQNRAAQRDRLKADHDYAVNRKAEKEIRQIKRLLQKHFSK
tara:strand:- start:751 stop:1167 length:417 start_codon:yes stop_codon:yes gene_type:complete